MHAGRVALVVVIALGIAACEATVVPTASPSPATATAPLTPAPDPTPVAVPTTGVPTMTFVPDGGAPPLECRGGSIAGADIEYVPDAPGVPDIAAATLALDGVRATDLIVVEPTTTVIVRDGRPIWRGTWFDGGRGMLLGGTQSCSDSNIAIGAG